MKPMRIGATILVLALLLTGCQTLPKEAPSPAPPDASGEPLPVSDESEPPSPGSGWDGRPRPTVTVPAAGESFFLTCWDGEVLLEQFCHTQSDRDALAEALPSVRGYETGDSLQLPEDPWPIYGLRVSGGEGDFEAAYCGGLWLDNCGNALREADVDFPALWEQFASNPRAGDVRSQPALRELALCSGTWDPRSMVPAEHPITNGLEEEIFHGNGGTAWPEVLLDGAWYQVPIRSDKNYCWTMEGYTTRSGESYAGSLWQEPYGILPDGDYRLVLDFSSDAAGKGYAAAPFAVQNGRFLIPE